MNKSESIKNLAAALSKFQEEIKNPPNSADNPFFKSKYAPLNDVLNLVRPILTKNGLSVLQSPSGDGANIIVTTMLLHSSGEWIETEPLVLKADKTTAQGAGSAITYARRYAISAVLGIASEDDDDGNHTTGNDKKATPKTITDAQQKRLFALSKGKEDRAKEILTRYGYKNSKDITTEHYNDICDEIQAEGK
ncbi:ERF family protein [Dehalobacter sp. DCM]|uniref:ERF family protein n=1 Tax=Dehalobacter sp. DCM TaxID=2907827 RepID=UPI003081BB57|nr:ERF family protein [Dehalobacter sp. DCM]